MEALFEEIRKKNEDSLNEAEDILIDLIKTIEESRCQPFKPKKP